SDWGGARKLQATSSELRVNSNEGLKFQDLSDMAPDPASPSFARSQGFNSRLRSDDGRRQAESFYATAADARVGATHTTLPAPRVMASCNACSARLMTSVTMSTASNPVRMTASARPAVNGTG